VPLARRDPRRADPRVAHVAPGHRHAARTCRGRHRAEYAARAGRRTRLTVPTPGQARSPSRIVVGVETSSADSIQIGTTRAFPLPPLRAAQARRTAARRLGVLDPEQPAQPRECAYPDRPAAGERHQHCKPMTAASERRRVFSSWFGDPTSGSSAEHGSRCRVSYTLPHDRDVVRLGASAVTRATDHRSLTRAQSLVAYRSGTIDTTLCGTAERQLASDVQAVSVEPSPPWRVCAPWDGSLA